MFFLTASLVPYDIRKQIIKLIYIYIHIIYAYIYIYIYIYICIWLLAPPITSVGLRMSDEKVRISAAVRLGALLCQPHICVCGTKSTREASMDVHAVKMQGDRSDKMSINDIVWRVMRRAGIPSIKEPLGLLQDDGKRPDGVMMIPWSRGRCVA